MRCLVAVPSLIRAGAETQAVNLANGLASRGYDAHLCSFGTKLDQRSRLLDSVKFHFLPRRHKYDREPIRGLAKILDTEGIEVVLGVMQFATLMSWLAARRSKSRPPVVAALHTTVNVGLKEELQDRLLYRRLLRQLPAIIFVCRHQQDYWLKRFPELKGSARIVYNGVDLVRFHRDEIEATATQLRLALNIPQSAIVFTCVAAFRSEKGHDLLVEAFARMPDRAYLLLAGEGVLRPKIEAVVRKAGLQTRVHFLGNVPDIRPAIVASDATILASTAVETFSMAMLESMALAVPMIATNIGGMAEGIADGETGFLCAPGDIDCLASRMQFVVDDRAMARQLGLAALERARKSLSVDRMIAGHEDVLRSVLRTDICHQYM